MNKIPMNMASRTQGRILFFIFIVFGMIVRIFLLPVISEDMMRYLLPWYDYMASHGVWNSLGDNFSNYTPAYLYLLGIATLTKNLIPPITAIKSISILFDVLNAFLITRLVGLKVQDEKIPWIAGGFFFLLPTVVLNSAAWGQADSIYACLILACLFYLFTDRPVKSIVSFSLAFAFKAQAIFVLPFLFLLTFKKKIPWQSYIILPVVYLLMMIPALLAGRSLSGVLSVYLGQAGTYRSLSMRAPNPYLFISNDLYTPILLIGVVMTILFVTAWIVGYGTRIHKLELDNMMISAAVSVAVVPFLLPKMHERYFYLMDVLTFTLAFYMSSLWLAAFIAQGVSILTYSVFLFRKSIMAESTMDELFLLLAACINLVLIGYLLWKQYYVVEKGNRILDPNRHLDIEFK